MERLCKKSIIFMLMLAMLVQMTGAALATEVTWTNGGIHIASVTAGNAEIKRSLDLPVSGVYHMYGFPHDVISIPVGTSVTWEAETGFPLSYKAYLDQALLGEGLNQSATYTQDNADPVEIPTLLSTGTYVAIMYFNGKSGTWWVKGTTNAESAPQELDSGAFSFAPIGPVDKPTYKLAS